MKTLYIHKSCKVPDGLKYLGELLWSSFGRRCAVCGKPLGSGLEFRERRKANVSNQM